jgi:hypothetical protein
MMRLMAAQASAAGEDDPMLAFAKSQKKVLEVSTEPLALSVVCTCWSKIWLASSSQINPHSPLIQGLLEEVSEADEDDGKARELRDTIETLLDVTLVRSGFPVEDMNGCAPLRSSDPTRIAPVLTTHDHSPRSFFGRVESLLRRAVGVPAKAKTYQPPVKPAPAVETGPVEPVAAMPDYGDVADEAEVERLLREVKDFGSAGAAADDELEHFEEFDREQLRRRMADMRHTEL